MKNDVSASDFLLSGEGSGFDSQLLQFFASFDPGISSSFAQFTPQPALASLGSVQ
jgi:hypothetical protein